MRSTPWLSIIAACSLILACDAPVGPRDAVRFDPPLSYRALWRTVEFCSGRTGALADVAWFSTESSATGTGDVAGAWYARGNRIYLQTEALEDEALVRHEMLHALLRSGKHTSEFLTGCGGLVVCGDACTAEAGGVGPGAGEDAPLILPSELDVQLTVLPARAGDEGWSAMVVSARNPRPEAVWVDLSERSGREFICRGSPCTNPLLARDRRAFRAGETRRASLVFAEPPGEYIIGGGYSSNSAVPVTVTIP